VAVVAGLLLAVMLAVLAAAAVVSSLGCLAVVVPGLVALGRLVVAAVLERRPAVAGPLPVVSLRLGLFLRSWLLLLPSVLPFMH
jgi:hypothetical protein